MAGTLYYSHNLNPRLAVAVARHLGAALDFVRAEPMGKDQERLRPLNPNTLVPILEEPGRVIWETDAIALHLAKRHDPGFWPEALAVEMQQWISWGAYHFVRAGDPIYFENVIVKKYFDREPDAAVIADAAGSFARTAKVLEDVLATRTWLVGESVTYADFRVACILPFAEEADIDLGPYPAIRAWHDRLLAIKAWRDPFAGLD